MWAGMGLLLNTAFYRNRYYGEHQLPAPVEDSHDGMIRVVVVWLPLTYHRFPASHMPANEVSGSWNCMNGL
jgi:hypothetical protein